MGRARYRFIRYKAFHHPERFRQDVLATVRALGEVCETDLMQSLRGSMFYTKPVGVVDYWSFSMYDYRAFLGNLVAEGLLERIEGQPRGGGIQTTYVIPREA